MKTILTHKLEYRFRAPKGDGTAGVWAERTATLSRKEDDSLHLYLDGGTQKTQQSFDITPTTWEIEEGPTEEELAAEAAAEAAAAAADEAERAATAERDKRKAEREKKRAEERKKQEEVAAAARKAEAERKKAEEEARRKAEEEAARPREKIRKCTEGVLDVHVLCGKDLAIMDKNMFSKGGSSDPYVKVELRRPDGDPIEMGQTETVKKSINPQFKKGEFSCHLEEDILAMAFSKDDSIANAACLVFSVFDKDLISADDEMGEATVPLRDILQPTDSEVADGGSFLEGFEFHRTDISVGNTDTFKKASGTLEVKATFEGHYIDVEAPALEVPALTANPLPATDEISEQPIVATQTPQMETEVENQNEAGRIEAGEKAPDSVSTQGENASKKSSTPRPGTDEKEARTSRPGTGEKEGNASHPGTGEKDGNSSRPSTGEKDVKKKAASDQPEFKPYPASKVKYLGNVDGRKMFASGQWYTAGMRTLCFSVVDDTGELIVLSLGEDKESAADWLAALQDTEMPSVARRKAIEAEKARLKAIADAKALIAYNNKLILELCWYGDMDEIKKIMGPKLDLTGRDPYTHATPLHLAAEAGHAAVVKELLRQGIKRGVDIASKDINGWLPLHLALVNVPNGFQAQRRGNEILPAKGIVTRGHEEIVNMLLRAGSDVNATVSHPKGPQLPQKSAIPHLSGALINGRFRATALLGEGSFGEIYIGQGLEPGEKVALKFEREGIDVPQLRHEYKVYRALFEVDGLPRVHHFGTYDGANVMVMDMLGSSIENLLKKCGGKFSVKTSLKLGDRMLERIEMVHKADYIHRDLKPANWVVNSMDENVLFLIDFGLARSWRNPLTQQHIPISFGNRLLGTARFASINNHRGVQLSRRDDIEAIAYMIIYFLRGKLPWQDLKAETKKKKYSLIKAEKEVTMQRLPNFCNGLPKELIEFFECIVELQFDQTPDYERLRQFLKDAYANNSGDSHFPMKGWEDNDWDWHPIDHHSHSRGGQSTEHENGSVGTSKANSHKDAQSGPFVDQFPEADTVEKVEEVPSSPAADDQTIALLKTHMCVTEAINLGGEENKRSEEIPETMKTLHERLPVKIFNPRANRSDEQLGVRGWERIGVPLSTFEDDETPLHFAARHGCETTTTELLLHKAKVHQKDWEHLRKVYNNVQSCKKILGVADQLHVKVQLFLIDVTNEVAQKLDTTGPQKVQLLFALIDSSMMTVHDSIVKNTLLNWLMLDKPTINALKLEDTYGRLRKRCILQLQELAEHLEEVEMEEQLHARIGSIGMDLKRESYSVIEQRGAGVTLRHGYFIGDRQDGPGFLPEISSDIRCTEKGFMHVLRLLTLALHEQYHEDLERVVCDSLSDDLSTTVPSLEERSQITSSTMQPTVAAMHTGAEALADVEARAEEQQDADDSFAGIDRDPPEFFKYKVGATKTFQRMVQRLENEYRKEAPPRSAMNLDVMRSAVTYSSLAQLRRGYQALEANYEIVKVVNSYNARIPTRTMQGLSGPEVYGFRDLRVNLKFAPPGLTFGMLAMEHCKDGGLWREYLLSAPTKEQRDITSALVYLRHKSIWRSPVSFICEVQLIYKPFLDYGRSKSIFYTKAVESKDSIELSSYYSRPLTFEEEREKREREEAIEKEEEHRRIDNIQREMNEWGAAREAHQQEMQGQLEATLRTSLAAGGLLLPQVLSPKDSAVLQRPVPAYIARSNKLPYGAGSLRSPLHSAHGTRLEKSRSAGDLDKTPLFPTASRKSSYSPSSLFRPPDEKIRLASEGRNYDDVDINDFPPSNDSPYYRITSRQLFRVTSDIDAPARGL